MNHLEDLSTQWMNQNLSSLSQFNQVEIVSIYVKKDSFRMF